MKNDSCFQVLLDEAYYTAYNYNVYLFITLFSIFVGAMMSVDDTLMCSFQILKPADKRRFVYPNFGSSGRPLTPPRGANNKNKKK